MHDSGLSTIVEQELCLVEVLLFAGGQIEFGERHLCNLMAGHHTGLTWIRSNLAADTIGIAAGDVEELRRTCGLPVGNGSFHHVAEVIELVRKVFLLRPARASCPVMWVVGILRACSVEVAVGLLSGSDDVEHRVYVRLQLLVGIGLQDVAGTLNGLVGVGVVERIAHAAHLEHLRRVFQVCSCILKVLVAAFALALREGEGDGDGARGFQAFAPERICGNLHLCERHG